MSAVGPDLVLRARVVAETLERGDIAAFSELLSDRLEGWDPEPWITGTWLAKLDNFAGSDRNERSARRVNEVMTRVVFEGSRGQAFVSVLFDETAKVVGIAVNDNERDGGFGIVIGCDGEQRDELRSFYGMLVRGPLGFGEGVGRAPRWRDPTRPQQIHLDVTVGDLANAETVVLDHGASKLEDGDGFRVYADPVGHPFCLYSDTSLPATNVAPLGVLSRVMIDCPEPQALASFWAALLDLPRRVENSPHRVVISTEQEELPMVGFQRVERYQAPQWPDPEHPAQMHFDISFDDRPAKERLILELGATRLPPQGGSCPVYADPAGHPFCLCYTGE